MLVCRLLEKRLIECTDPPPLKFSSVVGRVWSSGACILLWWSRCAPLLCPRSTRGPPPNGTRTEAGNLVDVVTTLAEGHPYQPGEFCCDGVIGCVEGVFWPVRLTYREDLKLR